MPLTLPISTLLSFFLCLSSFSPLVASHPQTPNLDPISTPSAPLITLPYITLRGAYSSLYNLTHYRRIPFGASTAGANRFRAPQPPAPIHGVYDTDRDFDACPQRKANGSEDCLYLGVYARPWTESADPQRKQSKPRKLRPVLLTFYGGGFERGSATFAMPPPGYPMLNASAQNANDYVVVYANYRTNVFGFLPGRRVKESGLADLNPGLLDQQAALRWIQRHIHHFGGDAADVAISGQSAGGGSVVAQGIATGNRGRGLFGRGMATSPFWPKTYAYDSAEAEHIYQRVVEGAGCGGADADAGEQIQCLKSVDFQALLDVSMGITGETKYTTTTFTWAPVIEGEGGFLAQPLSAIVSSKRLARNDKSSWNAERQMASYNLHEGEDFVPPGFLSPTGAGGFNSSTASFDAWLTGYLPGFGEKELDGVRALYPESGVAEQIRWNSTDVRAGLVYRDLVLACPAFWLADTADKGWLVEYTLEPALHASDTIYWNKMNAVQTSDPLTYQAYAGAMASFVQTGDPNAHKLTNDTVAAVPPIEEKKQFLLTNEGVRQGSTALLEKRCAFWLQNAAKVPF